MGVMIIINDNERLLWLSVVRWISKVVHLRRSVAEFHTMLYRTKHNKVYRLLLTDDEFVDIMSMLLDFVNCEQYYKNNWKQTSTKVTKLVFMIRSDITDRNKWSKDIYDISNNKSFDKIW